MTQERFAPLWNPFEDPLRSAPAVVMSHGEGVWVWDESGRPYLDASAGLWYTNVGHGRSEIASAVLQQMSDLEVHHTFGDYATRPTLRLATRLASLAPQPNSRVFFGSGGGDAIDTAAKLARRYWAVLGQPKRIHMVTRSGGYHGTHGFGTSLAGIASNKDGYGPLIADVSTVENNSVESLRQELERIGPEHVAAFLFEPVIAGGGLVPPAPGYIEAVVALCEEYDVLTIADSVVNGFGRLGTWYGVERFGVRPDMIAFAKGVTSGYLPLGGVVVGPRVAEPFSAGPRPALFRHGATYAGHPTCCAAALANLDILEREGLLERSRALELPLFSSVQTLQDHHLVEQVRGGVGLLAGFDFRQELRNEIPSLSSDALVVARAAGILTRPLENGLAVAPPLIIDESEIEIIVTRLRWTLDALDEMISTGERFPLSAESIAHAMGEFPHVEPDNGRG